MKPTPQKIYHITHTKNLPLIVKDGALYSDAVMLKNSVANQIIGLSEIKVRRLGLDVSCHPGTKVGEYVPFYFCPRSIMLYIIYRGNLPGLAYTGGQGPIVHLEADLNAVIAWANQVKCNWAFTKSNAGAFYTEFFNSQGDFNKVNWSAVAATDFREALIKEGKQAEFLLFNGFPWELVERVGVIDANIKTQVDSIVAHHKHRPVVSVIPNWYF